jgi:UDP-N-acetyl-D-glucosamine dehydrogenase
MSTDAVFASPARADMSVGPEGERFAIPSEADVAAEFRLISEDAERHRRQGGQVVVVQGLGFVGAAVAAAVASAVDDQGRHLHYVIGVDLARPETYWKVARINAGMPAVVSADPELAALTRRAVVTTGNLRATTAEEAYRLADVIIVDVHLDVRNRVVESPFEIEVDLEGFAGALRTVGRHMAPDALVLVETTVPVGACRRVALPLLQEERRRRGIDEPVLLAHAYERVMPGPNYVSSIRAQPRSFAGVDERSALRAREFLSTFVDVENHPVWELGDTVASELGKLLENSYRSMNIAFVHEWTLLAEQIGINLFEVVDSIRVRRGTHDNMRYPGFGVGGYCLTKDSLLAQWGANNLLEADVVLGMTLEALRTNYLMPLHTLDLVREVADGDLSGKVVAVCGVSYLAEVGDTRNSPAATLVEKLLDEGAEVRVHDPHVPRWLEKPDVPVHPDLERALEGADGVVLAVPHSGYLDLAPADLLTSLRRPSFVVDAQNVISDAKAAALRDGGCRVIGVGKGHWRKERYESVS